MLEVESTECGHVRGTPAGRNCLLPGADVSHGSDLVHVCGWNGGLPLTEVADETTERGVRGGCVQVTVLCVKDAERGHVRIVPDGHESAARASILQYLSTPV